MLNTSELHFAFEDYKKDSNNNLSTKEAFKAGFYKAVEVNDLPLIYAYLVGYFSAEAKTFEIFKCEKQPPWNYANCKNDYYCYLVLALGSCSYESSVSMVEDTIRHLSDYGNGFYKEVESKYR